MTMGSPPKLVGTILICGYLCTAQEATVPSSAPAVPPPVAGNSVNTPSLTRSIEGLVLDSDKKPISNAIVLLKDTKTLQVRSYIAQNDGRYHFHGLSNYINYQVRAESQGLTSKTKMVSVFDSHPTIKLDLKVYRKLNR